MEIYKCLLMWRYLLVFLLGGCVGVSLVNGMFVKVHEIVGFEILLVKVCFPGRIVVAAVTGVCNFSTSTVIQQI